MRKLLVLILALTLTTSTFAQVASRILSTQSAPQGINPQNFVWVDNSPGAMNRLWVANADSLKIRSFQMNWWDDSVLNLTTPLYKPLSWFPTWTEVSGKPSFSLVATSGSYNDLTNKPTLFSGSYLDLTNVPTIFPSNIVNVSGLSSALNAKIDVGAMIPYSTISGAPTLSTVATTGNYSDLLGKPTLFSGSYTDLTNKPTVFPTDIANVSGLTTALNNKVSVGASIPYSVLTGIPTIPAAQIQSDWSQSNNTSLDYIKNKPILGTAASTNSTDYATAAQGTLASTAVQPGTLTSTLSNYVTNSSLSSTLGSYVTSSALTSALGGYATTTALSAGLAGKENSISAGTNLQYWRGDKTWQTLNTTVVPEGTNQYYTDARFDTRFATKTTTNLTEGTNLYYTDVRARASNSAGTGISYNSTTGVITNSAPDQTVSLTAGTGISVTGTYPSFTVSSTAAAPTINSGVSRTLNSNYTVSTTRMATVNYSITISVTNPLLIGTSTGTAFLEYSTDGGATWVLVSQVSNSSGVGITVTVAITGVNTMNLQGAIPANALTRIRTTTSGTASVTYVTGQEVLN